MSRGALFLAVILGIAVLAHAKRSKLHSFKPKHNGTKHAVNEIDTNEERGQIALSSLANEYVHSLHEAIYLVNQAIQNAEDNTEFQKSLVQISNDATDLAFAIQKEIHGDARQLGYQIKSSIIFLTVLLPEIIQLAEANEKTTFSSSLLKESIDSTLFAVQKLEARTDLANINSNELAVTAIKSLEKFFEALNQTKSEDTDIAEELHIQAHHLNHILDKTVNKLEVWLHANIVENENSKVVEEVAQGLSDITSKLRVDISATLTVEQIKEKIESTMKASRQQIKNLGQVEINKNQANQEHARDLYRDILYDVIAIGKTFTVKLEILAKLKG